MRGLPSPQPFPSTKAGRGRARLLLTAGLFLLCASATAAEGATRPVADGAWSYFGDPRAIYANGRTFVGWTGSTGAVQVGAFRGGRTEAIAKLAKFIPDDHNNPSLSTTAKGRIVAFYAAHGNHLGRRARLYYRITTRPYDITSWGPVRSVPRTSAIPGSKGIAYPNPIRMNDGRTFVFWRGNNWWPNVSYTRDFRRWSTPRTVIRGPVGERPYAKYADTGNGAFVTYTERHPGSRPTSVYCLFIRPDGALLRLDGTKVGSFAKPPKYSRGTPVYKFRPELGGSWVLDIAVDRGKPVILYLRNEPSTGHVYRVARWDGRRWSDRPIVPAGAGRTLRWYVAGATLDHETPNVVYLARRRTPLGVSEVEQWETPDEGRTWSATALTAGSTRDNWRPASPRGLSGSATEVWWFTGAYRSFRSFNTQLLAAVGVPLARRR